MSTARIDRVRARVENEATRDNDPAGMSGALVRLCRCAVRSLPAAGSSISLMTDAGTVDLVASSDRRSALVEELQFTLGEGPSWEAFETRSPVLAHQLTGDTSRRWPGYASSASEAGAGSVFAFPLLVGRSRVGVFGLFRDEESWMPADTIADAEAFAEVATAMLLDGQEETGEGSAPGGLHDALASGTAVYQAQGMVMIQLGVGPNEAAVRLRAFAYANSSSLGVVARDIVARRLCLQRDAR